MNDTLRVQGIRWFGNGIFEIRLARNGLVFTPGDCLALFAADGKTSRPYSIASGTGEESIRFLIRAMPGGAVSTYLGERVPGDEVKVSSPFGWFRPGSVNGGARSVFIATGTGISPFMAHFRSQAGDSPAICLYGVRLLEDAVEVEWLAKQCPLRLAISREKVAGHHHGRVTDLLSEAPVDPGTHYYLCGLDVMIDEVTDWLEVRGVPITRIHRECFFNASYATT